jgi:hypothetical protein
MRLVNLKTCRGLETYVLVGGVPVRLGMLPEVVRGASGKDRVRLLTELEKLLRRRW